LIAESGERAIPLCRAVEEHAPLVARVLVDGRDVVVGKSSLE
jgi:hypothetical protein